MKGIGTFGDRIANRMLHHFPRRELTVAPAKPIVSFTFDDAPQSALRNGAHILEAFGARGTYYIAGGLVADESGHERFIDSAGCSDLAARGHELASHTFTHRKLANFSHKALAEDLDRNEAFLAQCDGRTHARNFALPFTMASPRHQALLRERFRTSRGGQKGINRGTVDPHYLSSVELRSHTAAEEVFSFYDQLEHEPGWLIIFTHDVSDPPSPFGYPPERFSSLVKAAERRGFTIATVDAAMDMLTGVTPS